MRLSVVTQAAGNLSKMRREEEELSRNSKTGITSGWI